MYIGFETRTELIALAGKFAGNYAREDWTVSRGAWTSEGGGPQRVAHQARRDGSLPAAGAARLFGFHGLPSEYSRPLRALGMV